MSAYIMNVTLQLTDNQDVNQWRVAGDLQNIKYHITESLNDNRLAIFIEGSLLSREDYGEWLAK